MSYRDELAAARARIAVLEEELAAAKRPPGEASVAEEIVAVPEQRLARRVGRLWFHPPRTYVPLLRLYVAAVRLAFARRPGMKRSSADGVLRWVFLNWIVRPLVIGVWMPLYCAGLCVALPILGICYAVASLLLIPILLIAGLRFVPTLPPDTGWFRGGTVTVEDATGALFWLMFGPHFVLFIPALFDEDLWPRR